MTRSRRIGFVDVCDGWKVFAHCMAESVLGGVGVAEVAEDCYSWEELGRSVFLEFAMTFFGGCGSVVGIVWESRHHGQLSGQSRAEK